MFSGVPRGRYLEWRPVRIVIKIHDATERRKCGTYISVYRCRTYGAPTMRAFYDGPYGPLF